MSLVVMATSAVAAEDMARDLRVDGFLARSTHQPGEALLVVHCISDDYDMVLERVRRMDAGARRIVAA